MQSSKYSCGMEKRIWIGLDQPTPTLEEQHRLYTGEQLGAQDNVGEIQERRLGRLTKMPFRKIIICGVGG